MAHALHNASAGHLRGVIRVLERHVAGKYVSFVLTDSRSLESHLFAGGPAEVVTQKSFVSVMHVSPSSS